MISTRIEKHFSKKIGIDIWVVILEEQVERLVFTSLRPIAKARGGYYKKYWGRRPSGFVFAKENQAEAFSTDIRETTTCH